MARAKPSGSVRCEDAPSSYLESLQDLEAEGVRLSVLPVF